MANPLEGLTAEKREAVIDHDVELHLQAFLPELQYLGMDPVEELDAIIRVVTQLRAGIN